MVKLNDIRDSIFDSLTLNLRVFMYDDLVQSL